MLGLGTFVWDPALHKEAVCHAVYDAISLGYRHIDTAWMFKIEHQVGSGIKRAIAEGIVRREQMCAVTKVWVTNFTRDLVLRTAKESNDNLGLGYIDLLLMHYPTPSHDLPIVNPDKLMPRNPDGTVAFHDDIDIYNETWRAMEELVDQGLVHSIGVSNFSTTQIETLLRTARIKPVVNQVESHPLLPQEKLLAFCRKNGVIVAAFSPFGGSPRPMNRASDLENEIRGRLFTSEIISKLAEKYNKSKQILLKFHVARGMAVIAKSVTKESIAANMEIFDLDLTQEELQSLRSIETGQRLVELEGAEASKYNPYTD